MKYSTVDILEDEVDPGNKSSDKYVHLEITIHYIVVRSTHDCRTTDTAVWFPIYAGGLLLLVLAAISIWVTSYHKPILLPIEFGLLLQANPKLAALIWTTISSLLSALTLFLLNGVFLLMNKQVLAARGATLSRIEGE
jgi:hypothetical protein